MSLGQVVGVAVQLFVKNVAGYFWQQETSGTSVNIAVHDASFSISVRMLRLHTCAPLPWQHLQKEGLWQLHTD